MPDVPAPAINGPSSPWNALRQSGSPSYAPTWPDQRAPVTMLMPATVRKPFPRLSATARSALRALGLDGAASVFLTRRQPLPDDVSEQDREVLHRVADYTMTSIDRQMAMVSAVRHLVRRKIEGCIVECGVWRGGSSMAAALTLIQEHAADRDLYLYDTFEGMTAPTDVDRTADGTPAKTLLANDPNKQTIWCVAGLEDVRRNMTSTGYPEELVHYVQGPVEETIPDASPSMPIALLRLDTDWYESTRHELTHLFPRLVDGGVLIVDDYGHWAGARQAVDEYLAAQTRPFLMHRIDYTGRLLVKQ